MTDEEQETSQETASESTDVEQQDSASEEQKMVPLAAMMATKRKLQEAESRIQQAEVKAQMYEEMIRSKQEKEPEEDPRALVEVGKLQETTAASERKIMERLYQDMNPEAVQKINTYLKPILEKKPWLATSVDTAENRYARAYEIVQDYMHLVEPPKSTAKTSDGKKIVENANKPGNPVTLGKSAQPTGVEYLKSIQGKKEFRDYRQKVLRGEA